MGQLLNYRRRIELFIVALITLFAFAARGDQWIGWVCDLADLPAVCRTTRPDTTTRIRMLFLQATFAMMFSVLIMIDFMFLDDSAFVYEPDVKVRMYTQVGPLSTALAVRCGAVYTLRARTGALTTSSSRITCRIGPGGPPHKTRPVWHMFATHPMRPSPLGCDVFRI